MATRATITVETKKENDVSIYKHYDGYIKGGLGEMLMKFVSVTKAKNTAEELINDFVEFCKAEFGGKPADNVYGSGFDKKNFERVESEYWLEGQEFKSHSDTEFHYSLKIGNNNSDIILFVQRRNYNDDFQNGTELTRTGHWTDFAVLECIGRTGNFFDYKVA
ncbi:MAG: hypothetical protein Unbinned1469contig1000_44 [Prokaryotic dsDNA virus sp.]|nr:MAG: hypothetical protein Unbinned1469contig1000_44 [Prokaryotic dsDNA virus sp.]